jgi:hypothetical protein
LRSHRIERRGDGRRYSAAGEVFVPFHYGFGAQSASQYTWYARDPISHQPQLKSSPVAVQRLSFGEPEPWLLERLAELDGDNTEPFAARTFGKTINNARLESNDQS